MGARAKAIEMMGTERRRHEYLPVPESCKCGWAVEPGSGARSGYIQWINHTEGSVLDALLAATQEQTCPACGGTGRVIASSPYASLQDRCPDCSDGVVPGTEPLVLLGPERVGVRYSDGELLRRAVRSDEHPEPVYRRAGSPTDA